MSNLRKNIGSGIFYTALSKYSNVFISIFIGAILARLLTPEEFGVVAIVTVFISFFNLLSNIGLGPAVVQFKELTNKDIESIFSFSLIFGLVLSIIFYFSAPIIASFYDNSELIDLSRLMALAILFQALRIVPNALLLKKLKFKEIGLITFIVRFISGSIAILLAYLGFSSYALVLESIFSGLLIFGIYYYLAPIKITFKLDISVLRKIAKYSAFQFFFNFINYFSRNADNLLIGKYFNASALGFYDKAYKLMMMPVQNLTHVITPVLHPVLSNYQNNKDIIYRTYYKVVKILASVGLPLSVFLYFSASEIITIIYGPQWYESIPVFQLLALTVSVQIILSSTGSIFQATNRTDLLFYAGFIGAVLMLSGIGYGIFIGESLVSVGYGLIIAFFINLFQALFLLINKSLGKSILKFLPVFIYPFVSSIILTVILFFTQTLASENKFISLIIKSVIAFFVFLIVTALSKENRELFNQYFWEKVKNRRKNKLKSNNT